MDQPPNPDPGHGNRSLARLQAVSGLLFTSFLALHLANTALAPLGQGSYDGFQRAARAYYQNPIIEVGAVLGAAALHMVAGLLRWRRRASSVAGATPNPPAAWRRRLHLASGYFLVLIFAGHIFATRAGPWYFGTSADFAFLNFSLVKMPLVFIPYYVTLAAAGSFHLINGTILASGILGLRLPSALSGPRSRPFWIAAALASTLGLLGVIALAGGLFPVDQGRSPELLKLYEKMLPDAVMSWLR